MMNFMAHRGDSAAEVVRLLTQNQSRLYAYILSLVFEPPQADDVLQETNVVLWQKASEFEPGTNFVAWMFRVAHFQVMAHRKRSSRERVRLGDHVVDCLAQMWLDEPDTFDERQQQLQHCLEKLNPRHRELLRQRYVEGANVAEIAGSAGLNANALKQLLFRARTALIQCVKRDQVQGAES